MGRSEAGRGGGGAGADASAGWPEPSPAGPDMWLCSVTPAKVPRQRGQFGSKSRAQVQRVWKRHWRQDVAWPQGKLRVSALFSRQMQQASPSSCTTIDFLGRLWSTTISSALWLMMMGTDTSSACVPNRGLANSAIKSSLSVSHCLTFFQKTGTIFSASTVWFLVLTLIHRVPDSPPLVTLTKSSFSICLCVGLFTRWSSTSLPPIMRCNRPP
mmetsp:Transcript_20917/g.48324  ORF Transcript_20917/g.48324 Transcript_20917/m.48324 type:complete len:213 (+) Transcript_20917:90-728(+)